MSDALPKWLGFAPSGVHMMGIKVTSLAGMGDNIAFGNCSSKRGPLLANGNIVKKTRNNHGSHPLVG
jgi:hypothetical protein